MKGHIISKRTKGDPQVKRNTINNVRNSTIKFIIMHNQTYNGQNSEHLLQ